MSIFHVIILAIVQGLAELLPVSSSAHVVVAEKLMGLDASSPQMTLLLVMLHTGTMFAVIVYFWNQWKKTYFSSGDAFKRFFVRLLWASVLTLVVGVWAVMGGLLGIFAGFSPGETAGTRTMFILTGLIWVAFGVVLFAHPDAGAVTLALLFGLFSLIAGGTMITQGIELRRADKSLHSVTPEAHQAA